MDKQEPRKKLFTEKRQAMLSKPQADFLAAEVARRKQAGITSDVEAAHGGNGNVNEGMLIREALEKTFNISGGS